MEADTTFVWSDNWYIEEGKAWFVEGWRNAVCCLDLNTRVCECIALIPGTEAKTFRRNPRVIKIANDIYCMPDLGRDIWIYQIDCGEFLQLKIYNPDHKRISIYDYWKYENRLYAAALGLHQILEIDLEEKEISAYYTICNSAEERLECSVRVGLDVYVVSGTSNCVYQFNLATKESVEHVLTEIKGNLNTICYDGSKFWLSGSQREVYVWDKEKNSTMILRDFPNNFGVYDYSGNREEILDRKREIYDVPAFIESRFSGGYVWFIPFRTNQIIYIDIDSCQIHALEMPGEKETKESLRENSMASKYLVQYLSEDHRLGLFSLKNNRIVEIDTKNFQTEVKRFVFDYGKYVSKLQEYIFEENKVIDREAFRYLWVKSRKNQCQIEPIGVGERIYNLCR